MTYYDDEHVTIELGDCVEVMAAMASDSIDAIVTDPPYGLEFMGKQWDRLGGDVRQPGDATFHKSGSGPHDRSTVRYGYGVPMARMQAWHEKWAREAFRVAKPGAHLLAFGGTRTYHRLTSALEDAGFEIRDCLVWAYASGFPKSLDVSKAIDKAAGAEREVVGTKRVTRDFDTSKGEDVAFRSGRPGATVVEVTAPATDSARRWEGWGTALKPAWEPIVMARKPMHGTVAANVQRHGTGALNIDGTRIPTNGEVVARDLDRQRQTTGEGATYGTFANDGSGKWQTSARWPANIVLTDPILGDYSRFFLVPKSSRSEREPILRGQLPARETKIGAEGHKINPMTNLPVVDPPRENTHPTVKPIELMEHLVRLVTPPGGLVLDPFLGSGTTALACSDNGYRCIGIDSDPDSCAIARARLTGRTIGLGL